MRIPSIKTLEAVFQHNAKAARKILELTKNELSALPGYIELNRIAHNPHKYYFLRLMALNALDIGLHGVESIAFKNGEFADYLNTGDSYAPTIIYWRGNYRVQSVGDFLEIMERRGVSAH